MTNKHPRFTQAIARKSELRVIFSSNNFGGKDQEPDENSTVIIRLGDSEFRMCAADILDIADAITTSINATNIRKRAEELVEKMKYVNPDSSYEGIK